MLQLASIESRKYGNVNQRYISALRKVVMIFSDVVMWELVEAQLQISSKTKRYGKIGWITGDCLPTL